MQNKSKGLVNLFDSSVPQDRKHCSTDWSTLLSGGVCVLGKSFKGLPEKGGGGVQCERFARTFSVVLRPFIGVL